MVAIVRSRGGVRLHCEGMTDPSIDEIASKARRRWKTTLLITGLAGGVGAVIANIFASPGTTSHHHHNGGVLLPLLFIFAVLAALVALIVFAIRGVRNGQGRFAAPLAFGLSTRKQRRAVGRTVRGGVPSQDETLRKVETNWAERTIRQSARTTIGIVLVVALELWLTTQPHSSAGRWLYFVGAVFAVLILVLNVRMVLGARKYMVAVGKDFLGS